MTIVRALTYLRLSSIGRVATSCHGRRWLRGSSLDRPGDGEWAGLAGICWDTAVEVPALPIEQHIAEKVHAYTRRYGRGNSSTRVKDLIDLAVSQLARRNSGIRSRIHSGFGYLWLRSGQDRQVRVA